MAIEATKAGAKLGSEDLGSSGIEGEELEGGDLFVRILLTAPE